MCYIHCVKMVLNWLTLILIIGSTHQLFPLNFVKFATCAESISSNLLAPSHQSQEYKLAALPIVLKSWERVDKMKDKMELDMKLGANLQQEDKYDFIIVGAGTAGSIVASRLAQSYNVLLMEAGGVPHALHDSMSMTIGKHSANDWMYPSVVQNETCILCPEKRYIFSAGRGLGGSANLNYVDALYEGESEDYTEWMERTKDSAWGFSMLKPYFKTVKETMTKNDPTVNKENNFYRSTFKAFVKPHANLHVQKYSRVTKIIIDDQGSARGVEYQRHGTVKQVFASKEVIISAGTFGSPKLLLLSGVGPKEVLNRARLPIKMDLSSVGKNFQDHLAIPLGPFFKATGVSSDLSSTNDFLLPEDSTNSTSALRMPLINFNYNIHSKEMSHFLGISEEILKAYTQSETNRTSTTPHSDQKTVDASQKSTPAGGDALSMFINVALKKPLSRGVLSISGNDSKLNPVINPNFFDEVNHPNELTSDNHKLIHALEQTIRLVENNSKWKGKFTEAPFPGCEDYIFRGYGYWTCFIRHMSLSFNHGVGTCSMGSKSSSSAVVDSHLKVLGIQNLRVIDASVIPSIIGTYPFLTVAVIGAKGADIIIKDHQTNRKVGTDNENIENIKREERSSIENPEPFGSFKIKKLSESLTSSIGNLLQRATKFIQAYTHVEDSSLTDSDLMPPNEPPSEKPNPSYFPVKPLAGKLIFHPLIPQASQNIFKFTWS